MNSNKYISNNNVIPSLKLDDTVHSNELGLFTRSVLTGADSSGTYNNVEISPIGELQVHSGNTDLWGTSLTLPIFPVIQADFLNGIVSHSQIWNTLLNGAGTVTTSTNKNSIDLNITTAVADFAVLRSRRPIKYYPGFSNAVTVNAKFDTAVALNQQFVGLGNRGSDLYFIYNGIDFGIRHSTDGSSEIRVLTITGASSATETATLTLNSVAFSIDLTNAGGAVNFTAHEVGVDTGGKLGGQFGWIAHVVQDKVYFLAGAVGPRTGTYTFSSGTATGTIVQGNLGVVQSVTYVNQTSWNGSSSMVTSLNPLVFNMYKIVYGWYGSSRIQWQVLNPSNNRFENVHTIDFGNTDDELSLADANMFGILANASLGSSTATTTTVSALSAVTHGDPALNIFPFYALSSFKTLGASATTTMIILENSLSVNSAENRAELRLESISISNEATKFITLEIVLNPTAIGDGTTSDYPQYVFNDETESITLYDISSLTHTGGKLLFSITIGKGAQFFANVFDQNLFASPEDRLLFAVSTTTGGGGDIDLSVSFREFV